jgi:hypothetical protein
MSRETRAYELPKAIDRYLAALSKLYAQEGKRQLQEIIVNAQNRVHEEWSIDNWNGGIFGHALYLVLPEPLFLSSVRVKAELQEEIKNGLNRIHNFQNEFIEEVFIEMQVGEDNDWRKVSGLLHSGIRTPSPDATKRIWGDDGFRVFLSHKSAWKKETADLKDRLGLFGASGFVAHRDIHPTREWQDEIVNALASMDAFVALMTKDFHESHWTDQEVGFAFARGIPIIAVRLGTDPYGFIGKFQALSCNWDTAAEEIARILIRNGRMFDAYVSALRTCPSFSVGNILAKALPGIESLTASQIESVVAAYNANPELRGSFGFNGDKSNIYGSGLVFYLNRLGSQQFSYSAEGLIEPLR